MSNTLRITGMATGMDTDSTVKQMMRSYQTRLDKMLQNKQTVQWKQDLYRDLLGDISTFKSTYFDVLKSDSYILSKNAYAGFDVTGVDVNTPTAVPGVTATAGVDTVPGVYTVQVTNLATSAKNEGSALANGVTKNTKLSDALIGMTDDSMSFTIGYGSEVKRVNLSKSDTIGDVIQKISNATSGNVTAKYSELTRKFSIETVATGEAQTLVLGSDLNFLGISSGVSSLSTLGPTTTGTTELIGAGTFDISYKDGLGNNVTKNISLGTAATYSKITGGSDIDLGINLAGKSANVSIIVGSKTYTLDSSTMESWTGTGTQADLISFIGKAVDEDGNKLSSAANISVENGKLSILNLSSGAKTVSISISGADASDASTLLGMTSGLTNTGTDFVNSTINEAISRISSQTGTDVVATFDEVTKEFKIVAADGSAVKVANATGSAASGLKLASLAKGTDATVLITPPGVGAVPTLVTKPSNIFSIDGITYNLNKDDTTTTLTVATNVQKPFDKIKTFIDKYNEMIDKINKKLDEKKQYTYLPLTDEQKKDMKDEDIKLWEDRAKQGLLSNDSMLQNMLYSVRSAFFEGVEGAGITLSEIGLSTSSDTSERGKIKIDAGKLKEALTTRGEQVSDIFTKSSESYPIYNPDARDSQRDTRRKEQGIFHRILDVLQDYTRTARNSSGKKGLLLEKSGVKGDLSEFSNTLTDNIKDMDKRINDFQRRMSDKENMYYLQFSKLEQAMNKMNSQSSWLAQQLGGGNL